LVVIVTVATVITAGSNNRTVTLDIVVARKVE